MKAIVFAALSAAAVLVASGPCFSQSDWRGVLSDRTVARMDACLKQPTSPAQWMEVMAALYEFTDETRQAALQGLVESPTDDAIQWADEVTAHQTGFPGIREAVALAIQARMEPLLLESSHPSSPERAALRSLEDVRALESQRPPLRRMRMERSDAGLVANALLLFLREQEMSWYSDWWSPEFRQSVSRLLHNPAASDDFRALADQIAEATPTDRPGMSALLAVVKFHQDGNVTHLEQCASEDSLSYPCLLRLLHYVVDDRAVTQYLVRSARAHLEALPVDASVSFALAIALASQESEEAVEMLVEILTYPNVFHLSPAIEWVVDAAARHSHRPDAMRALESHFSMQANRTLQVEEALTRAGR